jgi:hypothetical protein
MLKKQKTALTKKISPRQDSLIYGFYLLFLHIMLTIMIKIAADDAPTILAKTSFTSACLVAVNRFCAISIQFK